MSISQYIKEIGRGKEGARALSREHAADLMGQVLDGTVTDLEVGAFCLAMRIKGETAAEMAGFLDATRARSHLLPASDKPLVVLPSYNGARKLPLLTPLLALLVAREGLPVLIHGTPTENARVAIDRVLPPGVFTPPTAAHVIANGTVAFLPTELLCAPLKRLLDVRRVVGLRNPAHSLVKLMNPCAGPAVVVGSYTHPEYAVSMAAVHELMQHTALLLRGTEGEVVADPRRMPQMDGFVRGLRGLMQEGQRGTMTDMPDLPTGTDPGLTLAYIAAVLAGQKPIPPSIDRQVEHILHLASA